jgi:dihydrofolate reductase
MRKVIVSNFISLDGYVAGVGDDVMALPFDPSFDTYNLERIRNAGTLIAGRTTYEQLMAFWVPLADDPAASDLQQEIGRFNRDVEKVVVSNSLRSVATPVPRTTVVGRDDAVDSLVALRQAPGRHILCFGSHLTWNPLLAAGQVDELHLMVGCAGLGTGVPLFTTATPRLQLLDTWRADDADSIVLRYSARVSER